MPPKSFGVVGKTAGLLLSNPYLCQLLIGRRMNGQGLKQRVKSTLFFHLHHLGVFGFIIRLLSKFRRQHPCVILLYHRIVDDNTRYLDKGPGMHHHIRDFEKEIPYLKKNFQILSMDEVVQRMKAGVGFDRPSVAITFDDGYLDNYTLAYPVLRKHGVPATIYLTTSLIGTNGRTWPDQIEHALLQTNRDYFAMPELLGEKQISIRTNEEKRAVCIELASRLKSIPDVSRKKLLNDIFEGLGMNGSNPSPGMRMMLNWDEVREMAANGITFGSHSHTHPILSKMPLEEAKDEILISKTTIEQQLGMEVKHFAYPNGRAEDFSEELREYCREIGFESVASVIHGVNNGGADEALSLKRIPATRPIGFFSSELLKQLSQRKH